MPIASDGAGELQAPLSPTAAQLGYLSFWLIEREAVAWFKQERLLQLNKNLLRGQENFGSEKADWRMRCRPDFVLCDPTGTGFTQLPVGKERVNRPHGFIIFSGELSVSEATHQAPGMSN
jgi:hypothetical protein